MKLPDPPSSIFISHSLSELPHVRMLQILLEEMGYTTYANELIAFNTNTEESHQSSRLMLISEVSNSDVVLNIRSNSLIRNLQASQKTAVEGKFKAINDRLIFLYMDVDTCVGLEGDDLRVELEKHLDNLLESSDLSLADSLHSINAEDYETRKKAKEIYEKLAKSQIDEEEILQELRLTRGVLDDAVFHIDATRQDLQLGILGPFKPKLVSNDQLMQYNNVLLRFHPYPPYVRKKTVFLSHASKDMPVVRRLQYGLEQRGCRSHVFRLVRFENVFNFRDFHEVFDFIVNELATDHVDEVILLKSPRFDQSAWTFIEQCIALQYGRPILELDIEANSVDELLDGYENGAFEDVTDKVAQRIKGEFPQEDLWMLAEVIGILNRKRDMSVDEYDFIMRDRLFHTDNRLCDASEYLLANHIIQPYEHQEFIDACR